jgi:hypothetical protein
MRRCTIAAVLLGTLIGGPVAMADPPIRESVPIDVTFPSDSLSEACAVPVTVHLLGPILVKGFVDPSGSVVRELDTAPGGTITYSTDTGRSVSLSWAVLHGTYPQGVVIGAPADVVITGQVGSDDLLGNGRLEFDTVILAIDDYGIPLYDLDNLVRSSGNLSQVARICAALTR